MALDGDDRIVGFAYGYTGAYGQWWTDRVAARIDAAARAEWLDPPHSEVVEMHVAPPTQRSGVGTALLGELLRRQPHDRALLSTDPDSPSAAPFHRKHGWRRVASFVGATGTAALLGRRDLHHA